MHEVRTSSHYGIPVVLDQCRECGGIWFDEGELYRTKHGAAHKVDKRLNTRKLKEPTLFKHKILLCPKDGNKLKNLTNAHSLIDVEAKICHKCYGFWFNCGAFVRYQKERAKRQFRSRKDKANKERLSRELNKKIMATMALHSALEKKQRKEREKNLLETIMYVIYILFRILMRR
jgi:Zn-finger nucleic acid-binding protein